MGIAAVHEHGQEAQLPVTCLEETAITGAKLPLLRARDFAHKTGVLFIYSRPRTDCAAHSGQAVVHMIQITRK